MRLHSPIRAIGALVLLTLIGCGGQPAIRPAAFPPQCDILEVPENAADSIQVALLGAFEPGYPWARTMGERLLTRHCYETLVTIDCSGDVRPALAASWRREKGGGRWRFELRRNARFWDGTPVTAYDVATSWENAMTLDTTIDSVRVLDDRVLHVFPEQRSREVPHALASPMFAVVKPSPTSYWFLGTGPYALDSETSGSPQVRHSVTVRPAFGRKRPVIRFIETSEEEVRDMLERGIDLIITDDPDGIDYATSRSQYTTRALSWDRTYVLLSTTRVAKLGAGEPVGEVTPEFTESLARDAVRVDARGSDLPVWWDDVGRCAVADDASQNVEPPPVWRYQDPERDDNLDVDTPPLHCPHILFDEGDPVARDLAERIVALAATAPDASSDAQAIADVIPGLDSRITARAVGETTLARSLERGQDFAYIVATMRRPVDPCYEARQWLRRAPWLGLDGAGLSRAVIPLVDVRSHVIARTGRFGLSVDGYGNVLVVDEMLEGR
ncbi:MAG: hypothetical protein IH969_00040 [Candidatus Krumholzibacteriota bacterium]|nr:hypothetical protein [Candidatus Krumholzibacteriota bacterium]